MAAGSMKAPALMVDRDQMLRMRKCGRDVGLYFSIPANATSVPIVAKVTYLFFVY